MLRLAGLAVVAAVALAAPVQADTGRLASAEAFVGRIYAPYLASPNLPRFKLDAPDIASPSLLALLRHSRAGLDNSGSTDGDPVCNCRSGPVRSVDVHGRLDGDDHATVTAEF